MEIRQETTLPQVLAQLSRAQIDRPAEMITQVFEDYDFFFGESLRLSLGGRALAGHARGQEKHRQVFVKIPWGQNPLYQLISEEPEVALHYVDGFVTGLLSPRHQLYELRSEGRHVGRIHHFPNIGFVFTNKEPCRVLHLIDFAGEKWVVYHADLPSTLLTVTPYAVVTTASGELVAILVMQRGWSLRKNCLKLFRPVPAPVIPLMMAVFFGLQATASVDPAQRDAALALAFGNGSDPVIWP
jgi:hypothetical protein